MTTTYSDAYFQGQNEATQVVLHGATKAAVPMWKGKALTGKQLADYNQGWESGLQMIRESADEDMAEAVEELISKRTA